MRLALSLLATLLLVSALPGIAAAEGAGTATVRKANDQVSALLKKQAPAAQVTATVRTFLDIDEMGKRALSNHWATLSAAQQKEFSTLLRELIEAHYVKGMRSNVNYQVKYLSEKADGAGGLLVSTQVETTRKGRPFKIQIDYRLRREKGAWKVYDVVTDGVGMVENYRASFNKIIAKDGFAGLLERMRKKKATI